MNLVFNQPNRISIFCLLLTFFFSSCSTVEQIKNLDFFTTGEKWNFKKKVDYETRDFAEHLASWGPQYLSSPQVKIIPLKKGLKRYLNRLYKKIYINNELLLGKAEIPSFHIIKSDVPFYFSLPGSSFFYSSGLIKKYFKHEEIFIAVLAHEIIKSRLKIYPEKVVVPIGYMRLERLLSMIRLPLDLELEVNKWTHYTMGRAGHDGYVYLVWLQLQNRNTLDFSLQRGSIKDISREEYLFKSFIVKEGLGDRDSSLKGNSSKDFYKFVEYIRRS